MKIAPKQNPDGAEIFRTKPDSIYVSKYSTMEARRAQGNT
jgi:hypothetical protein